MEDFAYMLVNLSELKDSRPNNQTERLSTIYENLIILRK